MRVARIKGEYMLKLNEKYFSKKLTYSIWFLMAFQAGYVNVGGFFISGSFVSHVTGTSSRIGMGIANFDMLVLATFLTVLFAFIGGAAFAGHHIGRQQEEGKQPRYLLVSIVKSVFFGLVLLLSEFDLVFSGSELAELGLNANIINILMIFFLSFCCGVQNSTCALATNGFLKPTHMTGLSTDIGIFLTKTFAWKKRDCEQYRDSIHKNNLRISILTSFIFGGVIATMIFSYNGHYGFLFPFMSSLCFVTVGIAQDVRKVAAKSFSIRTAQGSLLITFITTIVFGLNAFFKLI